MLQTLGSVLVQAPLQPPKTDVPPGTAVSETDVPGKYSDEQLPFTLPIRLVQLMAPSLLVMLPFPLPARLAFSVMPKTKFAVTDLFPSMVTEHAAVPVQEPLQPPNKEPASGFSPRFTTVPLKRVAEQTVPQLIARSDVMTVPEPLPVLVTVSVKTGTTVFVCVAVLFAGTRSGSLAATLMELVIVPVTAGVTTMLTVESKAEAGEPIVQVTIPCDCTQLPCEALAETKFTLFGRVSVKVTPVASFGPWFNTSAV